VYETAVTLGNCLLLEIVSQMLAFGYRWYGRPGFLSKPRPSKLAHCTNPKPNSNNYPDPIPIPNPNP